MKRELLYIEKTSLQDFLHGNALNLELHHLYKHYLANNKKASMCKCTEIKVLNEVYRQYALLHGSNPRTYTTLKVDMSYVEYWYARLLKELQNDDATEFVACLLMGVLSVAPILSSFEQVFLRSLRKHIKGCRYYEKVHSAMREFKKCYGTFEMNTNTANQATSKADSPTEHSVSSPKAKEQHCLTMVAHSSCANTISLDVIAERILSLPSKERGQIFKDLNTLLVGTAWDAKAKDVLLQIAAEEKAHEAEQRLQPVIHQTNIEHFTNQTGASYLDFSDSDIDSKALAEVIAKQGLSTSRQGLAPKLETSNIQ